MKKIALFALIASLPPVAAQAQQAASPAPCAPLKQIASLKLERTPERWLIPLKINGVAKMFVFNPGTGASVISEKTVKEMKLPTALKRPPFSLNIVARRSMAHYDTLALGNAGQFTDSDMIVVQRVTGRTDPDNVAGSLGLDIFSHFDFDMDLANGIVNLFSPDHCEGQVVYWKTEAAVVIPFTYDAFGQVRMPVTLDGKATTANLVPAIEDNRMAMDNMRNLMNISLSSPGVENLPPIEGVRRYSRRFGKLELDGLAISNPVITMYDAMPAGAITVSGGEMMSRENEKNAALALGFTTLSKLHVYFAAKENKIYISPAPAPATATPPK